jgi:hypothetical protein
LVTPGGTMNFAPREQTARKKSSAGNTSRFGRSRQMEAGTSPWIWETLAGRRSRGVPAEGVTGHEAECTAVTVEVAPTSCFHMVEAPAKWWEGFIVQHGFASLRRAEIGKVIPSQCVFCNRHRRKEVGHQFVKTTRAMLVSCVECQASTANLDCPAVCHPIPQHIASEHRYGGQQIDSGLKLIAARKDAGPHDEPTRPSGGKRTW